jgi:hypothetical protein
MSIISPLMNKDTAVYGQHTVAAYPEFGSKVGDGTGLCEDRDIRM